MIDEVIDGIIHALHDQVKTVKSENEFLRQRLNDFNKKTWFPVYQENLELANENKLLKEVLKSVEAFTKQYSK